VLAPASAPGPTNAGPTPTNADGAGPGPMTLPRGCLRNLRHLTLEPGGVGEGGGNSTNSTSPPWNPHLSAVVLACGPRLEDLSLRAWAFSSGVGDSQGAGGVGPLSDILASHPPPEWMSRLQSLDLSGGMAEGGMGGAALAMDPLIADLRRCVGLRSLVGALIVGSVHSFVVYCSAQDLHHECEDGSAWLYA
jgi:hypothetical protein